MPTRNVSLTAEQDVFVEAMVRAGRYQTPVKLCATRCTACSSGCAKTT